MATNPTPSTRTAIYARVSTLKGQDIGLQVDELRSLAAQRGWTVVAEYTDVGVSGVKQERPGLDQMLADAQAGCFDTVLVWKLDRLGRSISHLLRVIDDLAGWGVGFTSARDAGMDTTTATGKLLLHMLAAFAEFEHGLIVERVRAGVARAQNKGTHCGRPRRHIDLRVVRALRGEGRSIREIASMLKIPRSTLQRHLREAQRGGPKVEAAEAAESAL